MEEDRDQPICRMCECPALDGVVPLSTVDTDKLTKWCILHFGMQMDKLDVNKDVFCSSCILDARLLFESNEGSTEGDLCWWPREQDDSSPMTENNVESCPQETKSMGMETSGDLNQGVRMEEPQLSCAKKVELPGDKALDRSSRRALEQYQPTEIRKWKCYICGKVYSAGSTLSTHVRMKHNENLIKCTFYGCATFCKDQDDLYLHYAEMHEGEVLHPCHLCPDKFGHLSALTRHMSKYHTRTNHVVCLTKKCTHCNCDVELPVMKIHKKIERCQMCCKTFSCALLYAKHTKICRLTCKLCPENLQFTSRAEYNQHWWTTHNSSFQAFECKICKKFFATKNNLSFHMSTIHSEQSRQKFVCEVCCLSLTSRKDMKNHLLVVHQIGETRFECRFCNRRFSHNRELEWHIEMYHPHVRGVGVCEVCGKLVDFCDMKLHYVTVHPQLLILRGDPNLASASPANLPPSQNL